MPALNVTVSLSEILEVRGGPLTDLEIWAFLCQGAEALQDGFLAGVAVDEFGPTFVINPDTLHLTSEGQVGFGSAHRVQQYANYMAPETEEGFSMTATAIEQVYMYALGKSLIYSSEYGLRMEEPVRISDSLESMLRSMTQRDSSKRVPLVKVLEACALQKERQQRGQQKSFSQTVTHLYRTVLGTDTQEEDTTLHNGANMEVISSRNESPRELASDRSRRKHKRSHNSGRRRHKSPEQVHRSRSHSRSRSRSRSHSRYKGRGRGADSPDSGYHRNTPLPRSAYSSPYSENGRHDVGRGGRASHLSDITYSLSQNGHSSHHHRASSQNHQSRPTSRIHSSHSNRSADDPIFKKYLKLKERQKKLRALRLDASDNDASDELSDIVMDHISEARSMASLASSNQGVYHPEVHMKYGSNMALRIGRDSDRDSVVSSEMSMAGHEHHAIRAHADINDPYIQKIQQLTAAPPQPSVPPIQTVPVKHKKPPSPKQHRHRDFYGPEFIHKSTKPIQRIPLALQGESRKSPGHVCRVVVVLLNGQKLEALVDPSTTGQQLFEAVVTEIELPEFYFFGLTYISENEHFFIPADTKLHKLAPDGWKESWKTPTQLTFTVHLRVKFYVETLAALKHETTRHQLYLQLRHDVLEERCMCDADQAMLLASLALQAEYGDYSPNTMGRNYFVPEHYFPPRSLKAVGTGYVRDHAPEVHQQGVGHTQVEAEVEYIKFIIDNLPEYGIHFHKLLRKKGETNNAIWVGVNINQLILAETAGSQRVRVHELPWAGIQKISFNRRRFSVQPRPEFGQIKPTKMNFFTTSYRKGQYLLKFCTAQHSFQLKMKTRLNLHDGMSDLSQTDHVSIGDTEDIDSTNSDGEGTITDEHGSTPHESVEGASEGFSMTDHQPQKQPAAYRSPPPYRPDSSVSMVEMPSRMLELSGSLDQLPHSATTGDISDRAVGPEEDISPSQVFNVHAEVPTEAGPTVAAMHQEQAYVIGTSILSTDQTLSPPSGNDSISTTLRQRMDELRSPEPSICEQEIFEVLLKKQKPFGIGITIVGGEHSGKRDLGIFVKSVTVDGPAFKDRRVRPGDRIIAINGASLEGLQHHEAVSMIKESKDTVRLLISQIKPPRSLKKRKDDDVQFQMKIRNSMIDTTDMGNSGEFSPSILVDEETSSMPVITVRSYASVHSAEQNTDEKQNKNSKMGENVGKDVCDGGNIPEDDQERYNSTAVHSTLSQVDSLHSEMALTDLPLDDSHDATEIQEDDSESDADTEFDVAVDRVIANTDIILATGTTSPADTNSSGSIREDDPHGRCMETFEVFLEKIGGSFGLNVTGGVNTSVRHGGIYVKSVITDSAADQDGSINKGDRILEVDNNTLEGFTHKQAVEALCNAPPFCKMLIERVVDVVESSHSSMCPGTPPSQRDISMSQLPASVTCPAVDRLRGVLPLVAESPTEGITVHELSLASTLGSTLTEDEVLGDGVDGDGDDVEKEDTEVNVDDVYRQFVNKDNTYTVCLKKGTYGLGFSTTGGGGSSQPGLDQCVVRIKRVFPIGPAAASRKILVGDVILAVNGQDVKPLSHHETMATLRRAGKHVELFMCHPDPEQLPPLAFLESEGSLEITPTSSTSNVSSDSDSDTEVTPRREMLITPPTGFAPSPYPIDDHGNILPKVASPPPLPTSPLPTLVYSGTVDEPEVEMGVAELMDSCHSEMVLIHSSQGLQPQQLNASLIVREDSALTVTSRDTTPVVVQDSRDVTPSLTVSGDTTPVSLGDTFTRDETDGDTEQQDELTDTLLESSIVSQDVNSTLLSTATSVNSVCPTLSRQGHVVVGSDSESDSSGTLTKTDKSNTLSETGDSFPPVQQDIDDLKIVSESLDTTLETYSEFSVNEGDTRDVPGVLDVDVSVDVEDTSINSDVDESDMNDTVIIHDVHRSVDDEFGRYDEDERSSGDDDVDDDDDNEDELSDNLKRLEEKYKEQEDEEEDDDDDEDEESESEESEALSVKATGSLTVKEAPLQPGEIEVTLTKPEGQGLGFTVAGGANTTGGCYIKAVLQNPALSDGNLNPGDKLITVNGTDMTSLNHFEAVTVLREASEDVTIRVFRQTAGLGDTGQASDSKPSHDQGLTGETNIENMQVNSREPVPEDLDEHVSESGSSDSGDEMRPIQDLIQSLEESGSLMAAPNQGAGRAENFWRDKSEKDDEDYSSPMSPNPTETFVHQIDLEKPVAGGLGISLVTAENRHQTGVYVRSISVGGVADTDGRLTVGDKILQINGESLVGMNHNKAAMILRSSEGKLSLTVSRNKGKKPTWLETNSNKAGTAPTVRSDAQDEIFEVDESSSSVSLTKHVSDDTEDGDVDDLVAEAEEILRTVDLQLDDNDITDTEVGSEEDCEDTAGDIGDEGQPGHQFLCEAESVDYQQGELCEETDRSELEHSDVEDENNVEQQLESECKFETDRFESEHSDVEDESSLEQQSESVNKFEAESCESDDSEESCDSGDKCWCGSLRNLDISVPDEVTKDWLFSWSLLTIPEDLRSEIPNIIADMQEKIEIDDPQEEFKQLRLVTVTDECSAANLSHNKPKNRFRNVLPYDTNRVLLTDSVDTDYINASHIQFPVADTSCEYIVCQGPLPETTDDFWDMVWQQSVTMVVMLTRDMESMKVKCHRYWPDSVETPIEVCHGKFRLSLLYLNALEDFDIRSVLLEEVATGESRGLFHLNYTSWPDHGTPTSAIPLLQCMRLSHLLWSGGPIVIHCSAGIGRSGTFITVDLALAHIEKGLKFDILDIVTDLRRQRQGMIQTRDQYLFCYTSCVEALLETPT